MTTKEQERKALEQIRKIVDSLGYHSYIGTAFEGCFEIAEENIENDFACSMKQKLDQVRKELEKQVEYTYKMHEGFINATKKVEELELRLNTAKEEFTEKENEVCEKNHIINKAGEMVKQLKEESERLKNELEQKENEIMRLKAKLYDLINQD